MPKLSFYPTTFIPFYEAKFPKVSYPHKHIFKVLRYTDLGTSNLNAQTQVIKMRKVDSNTPIFLNAKIMLKFRFTPQHLSHFMKPNFLKFHSLPYPHKHIRHFSMYLCVKIHMDQSSKIQSKLVHNTNTSYQV